MSAVALCVCPEEGPDRVDLAVPVEGVESLLEVVGIPEHLDHVEHGSACTIGFAYGAGGRLASTTFNRS